MTCLPAPFRAEIVSAGVLNKSRSQTPASAGARPLLTSEGVPERIICHLEPTAAWNLAFGGAETAAPRAETAKRDCKRKLLAILAIEDAVNRCVEDDAYRCEKA